MKTKVYGIRMEELLRRYIRGEVSDEERAKIARWLDDDPENMREFKAMRKLYDISLWQTEAQASSNPKKVTGKIWRMTFETLKIAAILVVGFFASKLIIPHESETVHTQTIHVPPGQRAELTLADGTEVWLNSGTTLRFPDRFAENKREVMLDGEGYFSVRHDANRPFTVQTSRYAVRVLGTEFNVKAYENSSLFETALIEGSVEINSPRMAESLRLKPNELAVANSNTIHVSSIPDYNYFKWKEGLLCFEDESIQNLMKKLELYYDITVDIQNKSLLHYRYTGKFRIRDGIEHVLKVLQLKHRFSYTKDDDKNLIVIK